MGYFARREAAYADIVAVCVGLESLGCAGKMGVGASGGVVVFVGGEWICSVNGWK